MLHRTLTPSPSDSSHFKLTNSSKQEHSAALALVSVHRTEGVKITADDDQTLNMKKAEGDADMQRATDLVDLHYGVKVKHMQGEDAGLRQARREVDMVLEKLEGHSRRGKGS